MEVSFSWYTRRPALLGFLNAQDMADEELFLSEWQWEQSVKKYGLGIVDNSVWEAGLDLAGVPLLPLIRAIDLPFYP